MTGWTTPPECQGQMIELSYGSNDNGVYLMIRDRADETEEHFFAPWSYFHESQMDDFWNGAPVLKKGKGWKKIARKDVPEDAS